jgi:hypothetical protein
LISDSSRNKANGLFTSSQRELMAKILIGSREKKELIKMNNINYYEKLQENFPTFRSTLRLDERQIKSLDSLLGFSQGALSSFRSKVQEADSKYADFNEKIKGEKRAEALREAKAKSIGSIEAEFNKVQDRVPKARTALHNATHLPKPKDTAEELLRFMQQKEVRDKLERLPLDERVGILQMTCRAGRGDVLWAVENQSIVSDLVPKDVMERSAETLAEKMAPEQFALLELAEQDLEGALAVKNLAEVTMGHLE